MEQLRIQIKTFEGTDLRSVEEQVNSFLYNRAIKIADISRTIIKLDNPRGGSTSFLHGIMIVYRVDLARAIETNNRGAVGGNGHDYAREIQNIK